MPLTNHALDGLGRWLALEAAARPDVEALYPLFCQELLRRGFPIWRASLGLEVLHPQLSGWQLVWVDESLTVNEFARPGVTQSPSYLNSPSRVVDETNAPFRRKLDAPCPDMPLLDELRDLGATDYVMFPLPFLDRSRTAALAFATRCDGGFQSGEITALEQATSLFGPYAERQVLRRIAIDLLDTYVGPRTGRRIIEGHVERGEVELIEAAIWLADLRGFTCFSETAPIGAVIELLNLWLQGMAEMIEAQGGEILKFIGDAVLAIFPISAETSRQAACSSALAAAERFLQKTDALNAERRAAGHAAIEFGLALHFGEIAYGNIGAARRLDFTVIGSAVNRASRLQELAKQLHERVLMSEAFAQSIDRGLRPLGRHSLRDVEGLQRVFGL